MAVDTSNQNPPGAGTSPSPSSANVAQPAPGAQPNLHAPRRILVLISIAVVAIMFVSMVGVLYWRWREKPTPSALLVLRVPAKFDRAVATVEVDDGRDIKPIRTTLEADQVVRISIPPGRYLVRIEHNGKWLIQKAIIVDDYAYWPFDLSDPPATQPVARASAKQ
jgi:hypothetical protein